MDYCGESKVFSATQVLGALFTKMRGIVELNHKGITAIDTVISVPCYFTDTQRRAVRSAAAIGGLNCLRVLNDGTATALSYGIFKGAKKEFPEGKETPVMFLDMGSSQFSATVATFTNTSLRVLATASDASFGGRDIDAALAQEFAAQFSKKTGLGDAWKNKKARLKLLAAAEKAKITLSPHGVNEAPVSIECLMDDRDFNYVLTAERMDELLTARATAVISSVIARVLATSGFAKGADFVAVELVGGSMRPRLVKRAAADALSMARDEANSHGLSMSMNLDEATARGCALACAMVSPMFKVKEFNIIEAAPAGITLAYEGGGTGTTSSAAASAGEGGGMEEEGEGGAGGKKSLTLFKTGDATPATRVLTVPLKEASQLTLTAEYDEKDCAVLPPGAWRGIGMWKVDIPGDAVEGAGGAAVKVKVDIKVDMSGTVQCGGAALWREVPHIDDVAAAEAAKAAAEGAAAGTAAGGMADGDNSGSGSSAEPAAAAGAAAEGSNAAPAAEKKKTKKMRLVKALPVVPHFPTLSEEALRAAIAGERDMVARDNEIHATQDMRNSLETAIYATRGALEDALQPFTTEPERARLGALLGELEEWLYNDGFSVGKAVYKGKLDELCAVADPLTARRIESEGRYAAVNDLKGTLEHFRGVLDNATGKHAHLGEADKDALRGAIGGCERWLAEAQAAQGKLERFQDPVLRCGDLRARKEAVERECGPIEKRPVPPPPAPPAAAAAAAAAAPPAAPAEGEAGAAAAPPTAEAPAAAPAEEAKMGE